MPDQTHIPRHDSDLRVSDATTATDVRRFLGDRLAEPAVVEGSVVWNFNSHDLDAHALLAATDELDAPVYVVPYQVPGTWGAMVQMLPGFVADAALLTYRSNQERYAVYDNLRRVGTDIQTEHTRQTLAQTAREAVQQLDVEVSFHER